MQEKYKSYLKTSSRRFIICVYTVFFENVIHPTLDMNQFLNQYNKNMIFQTCEYYT